MSVSGKQPEALLGRRAFLKLGAASGATLAIAGIGASLSGCAKSTAAAAQGFRFLRDADLLLLRAVMPVVLAGMPADEATREDILRGIDNQFLRAAGPTRQNLHKLFDLLHFSLTRRLLAGVSEPWARASAADIESFLRRWRESRIGLFNLGYAVLTRLPLLNYFSSPAGQEFVGYRPLPRVFDVVNA